MIFEKSTQGRAGNWKAVVEYVPWSDSVQIWLAEMTNGKTLVAHVTDKGRIEMDEVKPGETPAPTIWLYKDAWAAISEALSQAVPPVKQEIIDAELKATKYHLEDMRKLALKKTK